jgi:hypothetical protein
MGVDHSKIVFGQHHKGLEIRIEDTLNRNDTVIEALYFLNAMRIIVDL